MGRNRNNMKSKSSKNKNSNKTGKRDEKIDLTSMINFNELPNIESEFNIQTVKYYQTILPQISKDPSLIKNPEEETLMLIVFKKDTRELKNYIADAQDYITAAGQMINWLKNILQNVNSNIMVETPLRFPQSKWLDRLLLSEERNKIQTFAMQHNQSQEERISEKNNECIEELLTQIDEGLNESLRLLILTQYARVDPDSEVTNFITGYCTQNNMWTTLATLHLNNSNSYTNYHDINAYESACEAYQLFTSHREQFYNNTLGIQIIQQYILAHEWFEKYDKILEVVDKEAHNIVGQCKDTIVVLRTLKAYCVQALDPNLRDKDFKDNLKLISNDVLKIINATANEVTENCKAILDLLFNVTKFCQNKAAYYQNTNPTKFSKFKEYFSKFYEQFKKCKDEYLNQCNDLNDFNFKSNLDLKDLILSNSEDLLKSETQLKESYNAIIALPKEKTKLSFLEALQKELQTLKDNSLLKDKILETNIWNIVIFSTNLYQIFIKYKIPENETLIFYEAFYNKYPLLKQNVQKYTVLYDLFDLYYRLAKLAISNQEPDKALYYLTEATEHSNNLKSRYSSYFIVQELISDADNKLKELDVILAGESLADLCQ